VKEKLISLLTAWEQVEFKEEHFKYTKYSQFYKICINKYGSKSIQITNGYQSQL
jgi:hypothetical protein